jgi:predicted aspartyl protease
VTTRFAYDKRLDPPAPIVPVRVAGPIGENAALLRMLVDTGADCTLVPVHIVRRLGLPQVDIVGLSGVGGVKQRATVHAASIGLGGVRVTARIVAFDDEAILGRDVLNQCVMTLDGPGLTISLQPAPRPRRRLQARR